MALINRLTAGFLLLAVIAGCGSAGGGGVRTGLPGAEADRPALSEAQPEQDGQKQADTQQNDGARRSGATMRPEQLFLVRPEGSRGSMVAYNMNNGQEHFRLPAGMASADGKYFYSAAAMPLTTLVQVFRLPQAETVKEIAIDGRWSLSGVSPTGRWLALTRIPDEGEIKTWREQKQWLTDIRILDSETGRLVQTLNLEGNFEVETISADGSALFLVQHLPAEKPDHYLIRLYDLRAAQLQEDPLVAKGPQTDQVMAGYAWGGVASPDGTWLLTLYLSTRRNVAFIHALNMESRFPFCIDLPSGAGDFDELKYYTLALAPSGQEIYAANPALGLVAKVSLQSMQVVNTAHFTPSEIEAQSAADQHVPSSRSVLSSDGSLLYFASGSTIWVYDTKAGSIGQPLSAEGQVIGLGLSDDGSRLYVAGSGSQPQIFDTASGQLLRTIGAAEGASGR